MGWYIIIQLFYVAVNVWMAFYHAKLIKENKPINHPKWALIYVLTCLPTVFVSKVLFAAVIIFRLPVFNTTLNKLRGLPLFYVGQGSLIDRVIRNYYPYVFWGCIGVTIILNFFIK